MNLYLLSYVCNSFQITSDCLIENIFASYCFKWPMAIYRLSNNGKCFDIFSHTEETH